MPSFPPPDKEQYYPLVEVSWWSEDVLILARCSGSLTVSSARTLRNLLGKSCECPQWRKVAWSPDCNMLAYADSTGTVHLFDLIGSELFLIPPVNPPPPPSPHDLDDDTL
ncbi:hypothetical protein CRUP_009505 [Coryphaenoides rupestris]|nr:hypothetical protein CRUP_009505 [Coryphaenoides rupestris]